MNLRPPFWGRQQRPVSEPLMWREQRRPRNLKRLRQFDQADARLEYVRRHGVPHPRYRR